MRALLCEGGPRLHAQLIDAGLVDELFVTHAPKLVGGDGPGLAVGLPELERPLEVVWLLERGRRAVRPLPRAPGLDELEARRDPARRLDLLLAAAEHPQGEDGPAQGRGQPEADLDAQDPLARPVDVAQVEQQRGLVEGQPDPGAERDREPRSSSGSR